MNSVVITGGAGFIGTALAKALAVEGYTPLVLDTASRLAAVGSSLEGVETGILDFPEIEDIGTRLRGATALYHLACTTNPSLSMESMVCDAKANIAPSLALFEAAAVAGVKRIVFASSGGTIYGVPRILPVGEDGDKAPLCAYGVSKLAVENYLSLYGQSTAVETISLRPGNPYGPYQLCGVTIGVIARYLSLIAAGEPLEVWGNGGVVRDYIWIEDLAQAFVLALRDDLPTGAYNIGSGIGMSINDIIALIFRVTGRKVPVRNLPARSFDVPGIVLDSARFRELTGWKPQTPIEEGIALMWRNCKGGGKEI